MLWCPNCKVEYREGYTVCSDCGSVLVNSEEKDKALQRDDRSDKSADTQDIYSDAPNEPARLMQVSNEFEANNIIALLAGEGIPAYLSHKGSGQYLSISIGMSSMGVDIFVPKSALQQAKELIANAREDTKLDVKDDTINSHVNNHKIDNRIEYEDANEEKYNEEEKPQSSLRVRLARILLIPSILAIAYVLITYLVRAIQYFLA